MRQFSPESGDFGGDSFSHIPSGMDNDPRADEEVVDQHSHEQYPEAVDEPSSEGKIAPDNLSDSIAYALDGSGPGPTTDTPNVSGHKVISEGITGAGLDEEEEAIE